MGYENQERVSDFEQYGPESGQRGGLGSRQGSLLVNSIARIELNSLQSTKLITATPLEQEPVILVWDLRNSNAPEKVCHLILATHIRLQS